MAHVHVLGHPTLPLRIEKSEMRLGFLPLGTLPPL